MHERGTRGPIRSCNAWRSIDGGAWGLAAPDVKDGTKFYLQFQIGYEYGSVAY
ncbi:hypothetical protein [Streptomyces sp. 142MFCol3.1]|uniref:hypothetical protein n=1 Tax=Streptomyces sp. 142MFCol3.1 TaxID=1172179 RepID=UPI00041EE368|nr:hypothetical protein [Streptomyces sp. 142MFCol3.1]